LLEANTGPPIPPPLPRQRRGFGWPLAAAAGVLLLGLGLTLALVPRGKGPPEPTNPAAPQGGAVGGDAPVSMVGHPAYCGSLAFTEDGLHAVSESGGGGTYFWDLQKRCLLKAEPHGLQIRDPEKDFCGVVAVSPGGDLIAAAGALPPRAYMNLVELFDQKSFKLLTRDFAFFSGTMGRAAAFSPGKPRLFVTEDLPGLFGLPKPTIRIIEVETGKNRKTLPSPSPVRCFAFSPDGKILAVAGDERTIRLRNMADYRQEREFRGHTDAVDQVAFSGDGKRLFSASGADGTLRVWDNDAAAAVVEKERTKVDLRLVPSPMQCAALSAGGRALTGHEDGTLVLWDLAAGTERKRFADPGNRVTAVALSPDGQQALAARQDHLLYLYRLPRE
jgi:WD40 repeat protein